MAARNYLPRTPGLVPQADFPDVFNPASTYKYLAPGPIWVNGTYFDFPDSPSKPRASIWVPDDFPGCESESGRFFSNRGSEPRSPAVYAIWSVGPDLQSSRFPRSGMDGAIDESRFPLPRAFWLRSSSDKDGLIARFRARTGAIYDSP